MKIKIYQVNMERDEKRIAFMGLDKLPKFQGSSEVKSSLYDSVYVGEVDCKNLEEVYRKFNLEHPAGYKARSLSVSDVVEVIESDSMKSGFYFCDSFGFKEVPFEPTKTQIGDRFCDAEKVKTISVLLVQPGKYPKMIELESELEAMQRVVGGDIEEYMPFEDEVAIICNEEGKVNGLPLNRAVYAEPEEVDMTYQEMKNRFREAEKTHGAHLTGYLVFSQESFQSPYSEQSRTYQISSDNKAFNCTTGGYSIFGDSLDGSDRGVRLDLYMADERGGKDGWKVERCYMKEDSREMIDIMAGDFFIAYAPISSEKYLSLPDDLAKKYSEKFRFPERFFQTADGMKAVPFTPISKDRER